MNYYQNKTILITGASSGIGLEFAHQLNAMGAKLILTARRESVLDQLVDKFQDAIAIPGDLCDKTFPKRLKDDINAKGLHVDILINNAGFGSGGLFLHSDADIYENMIQVNISALTTLTYLFIPGMIERGEGGIINVASVAAFQPVPYMNVYSATKAYVKSFSLALSSEYKDKGINVTTVCPGYTDTNFHATANISSDPVSGSAMQSDVVVKQSLLAHQQEKIQIINGWMNRITAHANRLVPISIALFMTKVLMKKIR